MGAVGGILYLGLAALMYPVSKTKGVGHVSYRPLFLIVSLIMVTAVLILYLTIKEPKLEAENQKLELPTQNGILLPMTGRAMRCCPRRSSAA